jgi:hypothetical protein
MFANKTVILAILNGITRRLDAGKEINMTIASSKWMYVISLMQLSPERKRDTRQVIPTETICYSKV